MANNAAVAKKTVKRNIAQNKKAYLFIKANTKRKITRIAFYINQYALFLPKHCFLSILV